MGYLPALSADQNYRGRGALIGYRGHTLHHGTGRMGFKGARWTIYNPAGEAWGVSRTFKDAQSMVDERVHGEALCKRIAGVG